MERISKYQLAAMIILFQIGSTPLIALGIKAKQDAWLAVIIGIIAGLLLLFLFLAIQRREPGKNLFHIFTLYLGPYFGRLMTMVYILLFTYESMRNVRDFGELTVMTVLSNTPISLIMAVMMLLSCYAIYKGIEVFFRFAEFLLPGVIVVYGILIIMYLISGQIHWKFLFPILENGIAPVLLEDYKVITWFPFGQMMVFLIFWSSLNDQKTLTKTTVRAYFVSAAIILVMDIINLVVLGPGYSGISIAPLLQSVQLIEIADVFERFDVIIILLFYIGLLIKATLWFLAAVLGLSQLFNVNYRKFILPVGGLIYITALLPRTWQQHLEIGALIGEKLKMNPICLLAIPFMLYMVMLVRGSQSK